MLFFTADWLEQKNDLAREKAWRASSSGAPGCNSPAQYCDENPGYFFHTVEEKNPWVEIDMGAPTSFSAVRVINRRDCCRERADPLVLESSDDQQKWKLLARHDGNFSSWKANFPATRARYLRVRIEKPGINILHLSGVRVLP
ncbi:MAG: discoidin domain-containing protein [Polyangiaceae bacterium]